MIFFCVVAWRKLCQNPNAVLSSILYSEICLLGCILQLFFHKVVQETPEHMSDLRIPLLKSYTEADPLCPLTSRINWIAFLHTLDLA